MTGRARLLFQDFSKEMRDWRRVTGSADALAGALNLFGGLQLAGGGAGAPSEKL